MTKLFFPTLLLSALSFPALGADLPNIKGPPAYEPSPPEFSWTGFNIGINGGYGGDNFVYPASIGGATGAASITSSGFLAGGQIGFNYQFPGSNFVAGFEGDADWTSIRGQLSAYAVGGPAGAGSFVTAGTHLEYLGTARARLGMAFGNILPYVTGGFAYGVTSSYVDFSVLGTTFAASVPALQEGWTAGAGLAYAITPNLILKTEYLYADLGERTLFAGTVAGVPASVRERATFNIVRAGVDWKFDWGMPTTPVVAKY
jgi:outer membrane immunogenic protein